jgi:hypothetical protein
MGDILATPEVLFKAHGGVLFPVGWAGKPLTHTPAATGQG